MNFENDSLKRKRDLEERTSRFAAAVFVMLDALPVCVSTKVIAFQLGKSASSIGANYREANRAESRNDFTHKIGIVLKETSETVYWLGILAELYPGRSDLEHLSAESLEFLRIFQSTNRTLRTKEA